MNQRPDRHALDELATALYTSLQGSCLVRAEEHIRSGHGELLFNALLRYARERAHEQHSVKASLMALFERIMDTNAGVGMYFMGRLYRIAGKEHDVYNAIELWANASRSLDAADFLQLLAGELGPNLRKKFSDWVEKIKRNSLRTS
jgi:hypothetical protein